MPSSIINLAAYREGIHRAHRAGHITYSKQYVPESGEMRFSNHISWDINAIHYEGGLSFTNTRPLFDGIRLAFGYFEDDSLTFLELGPGAGNAEAILQRLRTCNIELVVVCAVDAVGIVPGRGVRKSESDPQRMYRTGRALWDNAVRGASSPPSGRDRPEN